MRPVSRNILIVTIVALAICYAGVLRGMVGQWWSDEDMSHGFLVPLVVAWIVWRDRAKWQADEARPSRWGLVVLFAAAALQVVSVLGGGLFAGSVSLLLTMIGIVISFYGFGRLRLWAFPCLLLLFMLPKLAIVYNQFTLPLQLLASRMAAGMLTASGFGVIREGNILDVGGHRIAVAEACNGIRFLLPLGFMAAVFAYLIDTKVWMRVALLAAAVPIAIVANALRVAIAGAWPPAAVGTLHELSGVVIFVFCLAALVATRRLFHAAYEVTHA